MHDNQRFATVITHVSPHQALIDAPWLEAEHHIDDSDWVVLSDDGWRAVADGDPDVWDDLARKLMVGYYVSRPELVVVIGHPSGDDDGQVERRQADVRRIVERIRSLLLPAGVMGIWTNELGALQDVLEPAECGVGDPDELHPAHALHAD